MIPDIFADHWTHLDTIFLCQNFSVEFIPLVLHSARLIMINVVTMFKFFSLQCRNFPVKTIWTYLMMPGLILTPFSYVQIFQSNLFPKFCIVLDLFWLMLLPCRNYSVENIHVEIILKVNSKKFTDRRLMLS